MNIKTNKKLIEKYYNEKNFYNINEFIINLKENENLNNENDNTNIILLNKFLNNYNNLLYDLIIIINNKFKLFDIDYINIFNIEFNIKHYLINNNLFNNELNYYIYNENLFNYLKNELKENTNLNNSIINFILYFINQFYIIDNKEKNKIINYLNKILF